MKPVSSLAVGTALCAAVLYGFWRWQGAFGLVYAAPVTAVLARPLVDVISGFPRFVTRLALRRYEGRHYAFRGRRIDIHIDDDAVCWVSTDDARKIVALPADAVLFRMLPRACRELGDPVRRRIATDGLAEVLAKSSDAEVTKFRDWLERDVARPARNKLARGMALR